MKVENEKNELFKLEDVSPAHSLSRILLTRCSAVALLGLFIYTAFEVMFDPPDNLLNFVTHHFVHVLGIGLVVWMVCWLTLQKTVFSPISSISHHLARLRFGRLESLALRSDATEVQTIIAGINSLTERLRSTNTGSLETALTSVQKLRVGLSRLAVRNAEDKVPIMRSVTRLESSLLDLMCREHESSI
jgi:methyl-accepting chemotaxis protein